LVLLPYVQAISEFLKSENTKPPLTLSVEGQWGSGKTSFMMQLKRELDKGFASADRQNLTVFYNAWRQDKDDAVWASFALSVSNQIREKCRFGKRCLASLILFGRRINGAGGIFRVTTIIVVWLALSAFVASMVWFAWSHTPAQIESLIKKISLPNSKAKDQLAGSIVWLLGNGWWGGSAALLFATWAQWRKVARDALHIKLEKYLTRPDYEGHVSFIESFHADFKNFLDAYVGSSRVYIFIDDLDRCDVPKAAELMQAINLLIGDDARLVFVLGMDREKVAAGIAQKYKDLLRFLPEFAKKEDEITPTDGLYFGYSYLEKFIQLTFRLPGIYDDKVLLNYLASLTIQGRSDSGNKQGYWESIITAFYRLWRRPAVQPEGAWNELPGEKNEDAMLDQEQIDWRRVETKGDSERVRRIVSMVSPLFGNNPRRLKQFLNSYRLTVYLASGQGLLDRKENRPAVTHEQLGKFVALMMRCPDLLPILQKDPQFFEKFNLGDYPEPFLKPRWLSEQGVIAIWDYGTRENAIPFDVEAYSLRKLDVAKLLSILPLAPLPAPKAATSMNQDSLVSTLFDQLSRIGEQYERVRSEHKFGPNRTKEMTSVVASAYPLLHNFPEEGMADLFSLLIQNNRPGLKLMALIAARVQPQAEFYRFVKRCLNLRNSNSWFEHYHALMAAGRLALQGDDDIRSEVSSILEQQLPSLQADQDRLVLATEILKGLKNVPTSKRPRGSGASA
jgi:hypothetical protein